MAFLKKVLDKNAFPIGSDNQLVRIDGSGLLQSVTNIVIDDLDNIGIGITPTEKLHLSGSFRVDTTGVNNAFLVDLTGKVGIGTNSLSATTNIFEQNPTTGATNSLLKLDYNNYGNTVGDQISLEFGQFNDISTYFPTAGRIGYSFNIWGSSAKVESVRFTHFGGVEIGGGVGNNLAGLDVKPVANLANYGAIIRGFDASPTRVALDVRDGNNVSLLRTQNDGKVGIGTSSPVEKLHINGNAKIDGRLLVTHDNYLFNGTTVTSRISNNLGNMIEFTDGGGINLNNYVNNLGADLGTQIFNSYFLGYNFSSMRTSPNPTGTSYLYFDRNLANSAPFTRMGINGINTSTHDILHLTLDKGGTDIVANPTMMKFIDSYGVHTVDMGGITYTKTGLDISLTNTFTTSTTGAGVNRAAYFNASGGNINYALITNSGNVGFGLTNPNTNYRVHINGSERVDGNIDLNGFVRFNYSGFSTIGIASGFSSKINVKASQGFLVSEISGTNYFDITPSGLSGNTLTGLTDVFTAKTPGSTNTTSYFKISTDLLYADIVSQNVGIGTAYPAEKLHVNGNTRVDGNIIIPISNAIQVIGNSLYDFLKASQSTGSTNIMLGRGADGTDAGNGGFISIGDFASSTESGIAIGSSATINLSTFDGIAIGRSATISTGVVRGMAFGRNATSSHNDAVAFGANVITSAANQFRYGTSSTNNIFDGNVGIGLTSPSEKLHVNGNSRVDGDETINGKQFITRNVNGFNFEQDIKNLSSGASAATSTIWRNNLNTGINIGVLGSGVTTAWSNYGTGNDAFIHTNVGVNGLKITTDNSTPNGIEFWSSAPILGNKPHLSIYRGRVRINNNAVSTTTTFAIYDHPTQASEIFTVMDSGNIGIGVTAPSEKLQVNGNARVDGNLVVNGTQIISPTSNVPHLNIQGFDDSNSTNSLQIRNSSNIVLLDVTNGGIVDMLLNKLRFTQAGNDVYIQNKVTNGDTYFRKNNGVGGVSDWVMKLEGSNGNVVQRCNNSVPADAETFTSSAIFYVDETTNELKVKVKYSDNTTRIGVVATLV